MAKAFEFVLLWLDRLLRWYIALLMALLVGLTFVQVLARYLMHAPFTSTPQLARICLVWLIFMGAAMAVRYGKNIRIETVEQFLPALFKRYINLFFDFLLLCLLIMLTYKGYQLSVVAGSQMILGTPFTGRLLYASLVTGSALMILFVAIRLLWKLGLVGVRFLGSED